MKSPLTHQKLKKITCFSCHFCQVSTWRKLCNQLHMQDFSWRIKSSAGGAGCTFTQRVYFHGRANWAQRAIISNAHPQTEVTSWVCSKSIRSVFSLFCPFFFFIIIIVVVIFLLAVFLLLTLAVLVVTAVGVHKKVALIVLRITTLLLLFLLILFMLLLCFVLWWWLLKPLRPAGKSTTLQFWNDGGVFLISVICGTHQSCCFCRYWMWSL